MSKDTFYFSHDSNAANDDKILALRMKHGWEGYGLFWALIERLRESKDFMSVKDYNVIAFSFRTSPEKIKSIINDFGLFAFTDDEKANITLNHTYSDKYVYEGKVIDGYWDLLKEQHFPTSEIDFIEIPTEKRLRFYEVEFTDDDFEKLETQIRKAINYIEENFERF